MSLINWNLIQPPEGPTPGQEVASVTGLLTAIAERRMQQQKEEEAKAFAERQYQTNLANQQADNARADMQFRATQKYNADNLAQTKTHQDEVIKIQGQERASKVWQEAQAMAERDPEAARQHLRNNGFDDAGPRPVAAAATPAPPPAGQAPQPPAGRAAIEPPPFVPQSPNVFPGAAPAAPPPPATPAGGDGLSVEDKQAIIAQMAPATEVVPPAGTQFRSPVGNVLDFNPEAATARRQAAAKQRADEFVKQVTPHVKGAFAKQALDETVGAMLAPTWDPKEDPYKLFVDRQDKLEGRQATKDNAATAAAASRENIVTRAAATKDSQDESRGLRGLQALRSDIRENVARWNLRADLKDFNEIKKGLRLIGTPAGTAQATALDNLIKVGRGGVVTKQSMEFIANHMGGSLDRLKSAITATINGQFSDPSIADARRTLQELHDTILGEAGEKEQVFKDTYLVDPQYAPYRANVETEHEKEFGPFGLHIKRSGAEGTDYRGRAFKGDPEKAANETAKADAKVKMLQDLQAREAALNEKLKALGAH